MLLGGVDVQDRLVRQLANIVNRPLAHKLEKALLFGSVIVGLTQDEMEAIPHSARSRPQPSCVTFAICCFLNGSGVCANGSDPAGRSRWHCRWVASSRPRVGRNLDRPGLESAPCEVTVFAGLALLVLFSSGLGLAVVLLSSAAVADAAKSMFTYAPRHVFSQPKLYPLPRQAVVQCQLARKLGVCPAHFPGRPSPCVRASAPPRLVAERTGRGETVARSWSGCRSPMVRHGNLEADPTGAPIYGVTARVASSTSRSGGHSRASRPSPVPPSLRPSEVSAATRSSDRLRIGMRPGRRRSVLLQPHAVPLAGGRRLVHCLPSPIRVLGRNRSAAAQTDPPASPHLRRLSGRAQTTRPIERMWRQPNR